MWHKMLPMKKKDKIETIAKELFFAQGIKKTSIDEICKKAGVSRKTFYTLYSNKQDVAMAVFTKFGDESLELSRQIIASNDSFAEKLKTMLNLKYEMSRNISMDFVNDLMQPETAELMQYMAKIQGESFVMMRNFFEEAQKNGEMNPHLRIDFVFMLMQKMQEWASDKQLQSMFSSSVDLAKNLSESIVYGIMPPPL